jgi:SAM-dependent methyltransferase
VTETSPPRANAIETHSSQSALFAERYERLTLDPYASCFAYSRRRLKERIDRLLTSGEGRRLLDVGCGTGHHLAELGGRGFEVSGVDGSAEMLDHARRLNPGRDLRVADVEALPFADATFDVVLSVEVLRYLPRPRQAIAEMARVLKPGGMALVTAAPLFSLNAYPVVNRLALLLPLPGTTRLKQFFATRRGLRRRFSAAGFAGVEVHGVYYGPLNWAERLLPRALPALLRAWERPDRALAQRGWLSDLSNMFLVHAVRRPTA